MGSSQKHTWKYIALGGACAVGVVSLAYLRHRKVARRQTQSGKHAAPLNDDRLQRGTSQIQSAPAAKRKEHVSQAAQGKLQVTWENLEVWAAGLKKNDVDELPMLLEWTDKLLTEQPEHQALDLCLKALSQLVGGHREADRVSVVAVKAGIKKPEQALEVLNALFKDRRQRRGLVADHAVVDFALDILKRSLNHEVDRSSYQRACRLVDWLALEPENRAQLASRGGCQTLLQVMSMYNTDPGVLLEGCGCLQKLAQEETLDCPTAISVLITCLQNFLENGELQWRALAALHGLPLPAPPDELRILIAKLACAAADKHPRFDMVIEWTAKLLWVLTKNDSAVRGLLSSDKVWLDKFQDAPSGLRKANQQADHWVGMLCKLCAK